MIYTITLNETVKRKLRSDSAMLCIKRMVYDRLAGSGLLDTRFAHNVMAEIEKIDIKHPGSITNSLFTLTWSRK